MPKPKGSGFNCAKIETRVWAPFRSKVDSCTTIPGVSTYEYSGKPQSGRARFRTRPLPAATHQQPEVNYLPRSALN